MVLLCGCKLCDFFFIPYDPTWESLDRGSKGVTSLPGASSGTVHREGNSDWYNDWVS